MKQYLDQLRDIRENGFDGAERTGTGKRTLPGTMMKFWPAKEFPRLTTKFVPMKAIFDELMFFLNGETNNNVLKEKGCNIWTPWELKDDAVISERLTEDERLNMLAEKKFMTRRELDKWFQEECERRGHRGHAMQYGFMNHLLDEESIPKIKPRIIKKAGELGPVYGEMWRRWPIYLTDEKTGQITEGEPFDQLQYIRNALKSEDPKVRGSRRLIVSGWNPQYMPIEGVGHDVNIINGKQVLPPCHLLWQIIVEPYSFERRVQLLKDSGVACNVEGVLAPDASQFDIDSVEEAMKIRQIPKGRLHMVMFQRSCDFPVGIPFNIAQYSLLLMMLAHESYMDVGSFTHMGGDAHIYHNQFEGVDEQLSRTPGKPCSILLNPNQRDLLKFQWEDIKVLNYEHQGKIPFSVAV